MPPLAAIAAFGAGLLLVLGVGYLRGDWRPGRGGAARQPGRRFRLTDVDSGPDDLYDQVPCEGVLIRQIAGPDRPDYWIARLTVPLRWSDDGTARVVDHLVLVARLAGQSIGSSVDPLAVGIAYVVDDTLLTAPTLTFDTVRYVAIGRLARQ
jgi:hypothetical protein